jgi:hypothetical protein
MFSATKINHFTRKGKVSFYRYALSGKAYQQ